MWSRHTSASLQQEAVTNKMFFKGSVLSRSVLGQICPITHDAFRLHSSVPLVITHRDSRCIAGRSLSIRGKERWRRAVTCTEVSVCSTDHNGFNRVVRSSFLESISYFPDYSWTDGVDWRVAEADHRQGMGQPQILSHFLKVSGTSDVWSSPGLLFWKAPRGGARAGPMGTAATASCPLHFVLCRAGCAPRRVILLL